MLEVETGCSSLVRRPAAPDFCIQPIVEPPLVEGKSSVPRVVLRTRPRELFKVLVILPRFTV